MMKVVPPPQSYRDAFQPGAFSGAMLTACGIQDTVLVFHGVSGCHIQANHLRSDHIPDGCYVPIIPTGITQDEIIHGASEQLRRALREAINATRRPECVWVTVSDAIALIDDDVKGISGLVAGETGARIVFIDAPGFRGGVARGADLAIAAIADSFAPNPDVSGRDGINVLAPFLMGSKNWPYDVDEMVRLLRESGVPVNLVLSRNTPFADLARFGQARAAYVPSYEELPETSERLAGLGQERCGLDLPLPLGMANTEEWLLGMAERYGDAAKARAVLAEDMARVKRVLANNYNFSWMASLLSGKSAAVCGFAPFAAAMARFLFFDLDVRVRVVAIYAETQPGLEGAKRLLEPLAESVDLTVLENPTFLQAGQAAQEAKVDFVVGSIQDKPLYEGLGLAHINLGPFYFFNQFNFVPWPYAGVRGVLNLFSEMARVAQDAFWERGAWGERAYKRSPPEGCDKRAR
ncbi:MAG: nitrogenase component 1 [Chloroflexi bacterium]|nr:nitrogenase component 1 [Chloroflexota bacterium]